MYHVDFMECYAATIQHKFQALFLYYGCIINMSLKLSITRAIFTHLIFEKNRLTMSKSKNLPFLNKQRTSERNYLIMQPSLVDVSTKFPHLWFIQSHDNVMFR